VPAAIAADGAMGVGIGLGMGVGTGTGAGVATMLIDAIGPVTTEMSSLAEKVVVTLVTGSVIRTLTPTVVTPTATGVRTAVSPPVLATSVAAAGLEFVHVGFVPPAAGGSGVKGTTLRFGSFATMDKLSICER
jgi:hypothetical protein